MERASRTAVQGCALALALVASHASAQDRTSAEELFQLGKAALARQEYTKACSLLQASLNAEFALGTLLNLARCHEQEGKIASAWAEFRTLEDKAMASTPPQQERARFAHDHAEALRPRLSRLRVVLSPGAIATAGLVVKIDGTLIAQELFADGIPVDLGKRTVTAVAPDHGQWSQVVSVDDERLSLEVTVPDLPTATAKGPPSSVSNVDVTSGGRSQRVVGLLVGGIGVASILTGAVFGVLTISTATDARCPAPCPTKQGGVDNPDLVAARDAYDRANTFGWISNVALGLGVIGVGVGAYLVLTAKKVAPSAPVSVAAGPTADGGGLTVRGRF